MLETNQNQFFESALFQSLGKDYKIDAIQFVSGGCINNAVRLDTSEGMFFLKWNQTQPISFFEAEAKGLDLLAKTNAVITPEVLGVGIAQGQPFLLLEYIESYYPVKD